LIEEHAALPAAALADRLLGEVAQFSQGLPVSDDRTLVVLRVR